MKPNSLFASVLTTLLVVSCSDDKDESIGTPAAAIVKEWRVALSNEYEIPAAGTGTYGRLDMQLYSDNSLKYTFFFLNRFPAGDRFTDANLYAGDIMMNGPAILPLGGTMIGNTVTNTLTGLRQSLVDSLKSDANNIYINIQSERVPSGLLRGQLNTTLDWAMDIPMYEDYLQPQVNSDLGGLALLRLTTDKKLYALINVYGQQNWTTAKIYNGATMEDSTVLIEIYHNGLEFGTNAMMPVNDKIVNALKYSSRLYLNASSLEHPRGAIVGPIWHW